MSDDELFQLLRANGLNECDAACDRIAELLDEGAVMAGMLDTAEIRIKLLEAERDSLFRKAALADEWRDHDKARADLAAATKLKVTPLVWAKIARGLFQARTPFGAYHAWENAWQGPNDHYENQDDTPKAAAQADYEARILATIEATQ